MMLALSSNTQAILLLTAPLIAGRSTVNPDLLGAGEYKRFAHRLREMEIEPAALLGSNSVEILDACRSIIDAERIQRLLGRGFQLSEALERWQTRAIWVVSRADAEYPRRLKVRLRGDAPAVLYGCGDMHLLDDGGLAVVGSRHVDDALLDYTTEIGHLAARAGKSVISGGAKGIDQAAMRGALEAGGKVSGVLADSLEKQAMNRDHRNMLLDGQLTLVSPYDPNAGFNVGHAMQRNKLIYALSDAALVVSSDVNKGGTWAGAVEQLDKFKLVPVYVRSAEARSPGLDALRKKGAIAWPNPDSEEALADLLNTPVEASSQGDLLIANGKGDDDSPVISASSELDLPSPSAPTASVEAVSEAVAPASLSSIKEPSGPSKSPAETLLAEVRKLAEEMAAEPLKESEFAEALQITPTQARNWLNRFVHEGLLKKQRNPAGYVANEKTLL
jgi:DNA processing protein